MNLRVVQAHNLAPSGVVFGFAFSAQLETGALQTTGHQMTEAKPVCSRGEKKDGKRGATYEIETKLSAPEVLDK